MRKMMLMNYLRKLAFGFGGAALLAVPSARAAALHDGTFDGGVYDAYFGPVQVEITVRGGKLVSCKATQYPDHRRTSVSINYQALPILEREVVTVQSAKVQIISGATLTSRAYIASLADALQQAVQ
jgi:uncharacterized protein with FMN-binding domain